MIRLENGLTICLISDAENIVDLSLSDSESDYETDSGDEESYKSASEMEELDCDDVKVKKVSSNEQKMVRFALFFWTAYFINVESVIVF